MDLECNRKKSSTPSTTTTTKATQAPGSWESSALGGRSVCVSWEAPPCPRSSSSCPPLPNPLRPFTASPPFCRVPPETVNGLSSLAPIFFVFSLQVPVSPVARISQVSFPSSHVWGLLWLLCVSSTFLSLLPPFFEFFSLFSFLSSPLLLSPRLLPSPPYLSPPCLLQFCPLPPHQPCVCLSSSLASGLSLTSFWGPLSSPCLHLSLLISASLFVFFHVTLPRLHTLRSLHPHAQCWDDDVTKSPMVTGASEGQEGCPQAGLLEQGCRLKKPTAPSCQLPLTWAPAPAWKGRKPLIPLENPPGGALVPPLSTVSHGHAHTCSRHTHSLSVLSPLPAAVCSTIPVAACAAVSMPPVPSAPWSHVFTCAHTCIGAVRHLAQASC